jgi:hypothetical protein
MRHRAVQHGRAQATGHREDRGSPPPFPDPGQWPSPRPVRPGGAEPAAFAQKRLFVADLGCVGGAAKARMGRHGLVILSGWGFGLAQGETGHRRKRLVHQRVVAPVLEPAHLAQDGRGMQTLAPRQRPERCAFLGMVKIMAHGGRKPVWQAGSSQFWQFSRPVLSTPGLRRSSLGQSATLGGIGYLFVKLSACPTIRRNS